MCDKEKTCLTGEADRCILEETELCKKCNFCGKLADEDYHSDEWLRY